MINKKNPLSRRQFLRDALSAFALLWFGYGAWHLKNVFTFKEDRSRVPLGTFAQLRKNGITHLKDHNLFIIWDKEGLYAVSDLCTHRFCALQLDGSNLRCACHGAAFQLSGVRISGPAPKDLPCFQIEKGQRDQLVANLSRTVDRSFRYNDNPTGVSGDG